MQHFFVDKSCIDEAARRVVITGSDYNHIKNVLRMAKGEELSVSLKEDTEERVEYRLGILKYTDNSVICEIRFTKEANAELPCRIYLFQGLPKSDKMEYIVKKAVELGAYEIIPVAMKRSVVKLDEKKALAKIGRWQQISEAAAKQSKRAIIPGVGNVMSFPEAVETAKGLDRVLIPYELMKDENSSAIDRTREVIGSIEQGQSIGIFVGPEGGFDEDEIALAEKSGFEKISLGNRILRTETAPLCVLSFLIYALDK